MRKKILLTLIIIIIIVTGLIMYKVFNKKPNRDINLTDQFDTNLIKIVNFSNKKNYLVSPYSIKMALALLKEGANGNTLDEISKTIGSNPSLINNNSVKVANALFLRDIYSNYVEKSYIKNLQNKYKSEVLIDEFKTPDVINNWVNKNTDGMIKKILDEMDDSFVLGLANAIAIDVKWEYPFECSNTYEEVFDKNQKVEMMHKDYSSESVKYLKSDNATGIIIPYKEETNLEFIGLLPNNNMDTYINNYLEKDLINLDNISQSGSKDLYINLSIPRFKFDYSLDNFKDILIEMGIKDVFDPTKADLSKIITNNNLKKLKIDNIYVDDAIHKTYIDFNEEGTKAAAVTYFGIKASSAIMHKDYINIKFNKPFVMAIREKASGELLFLGVINTPNKWNGSTCE